ncbi:uncharacterized protein LOC144647289 [Oculina patagonica]
MDDDHSSVKSSKVARWLEESDMQCEHSSQHSNDFKLQGTHEVSSVLDEINGANNTENKNTDSWNHRAYDHEVSGTRSAEESDKECLEKETKNKQASCSVEISESKTKVKEVPTSGIQEKGTSQNNSHRVLMSLCRSENVANESEHSGIEGMSDADELSEPEGAAPVSRKKIEKKKRKKPKNNKNIQKPVLNNPRRKFKASKVCSAVKDANGSKGGAGLWEDYGMPHPCSVCKRDASFLCSGCLAAWYCSSECQWSAWGTHLKECGWTGWRKPIYSYRLGEVEVVDLDPAYIT